MLSVSFMNKRWCPENIYIHGCMYVYIIINCISLLQASYYFGLGYQVVLCIGYLKDDCKIDDEKVITYLYVGFPYCQVSCIPCTNFEFCNAFSCRVWPSKTTTEGDHTSPTWLRGKESLSLKIFQKHLTVFWKSVKTSQYPIKLDVDNFIIHTIYFQSIILKHGGWFRVGKGKKSHFFALNRKLGFLFCKLGERDIPIWLWLKMSWIDITLS